MCINTRLPGATYQLPDTMFTEAGLVPKLPMSQEKIP